MKPRQHNLTIIISVLVCLISFSCKDYTCECIGIHGNNNNPQTQNTITDITIQVVSKSKATQQCESHSTAADQYGNKTTCEIK